MKFTENLQLILNELDEIDNLLLDLELDDQEEISNNINKIRQMTEKELDKRERENYKKYLLIQENTV